MCEIAIKFSQAELIQKRERVIDITSELNILYQEADKIMRSIGGYYSEQDIKHEIFYGEKTDREKVGGYIDKYFWRHIINESGFDRVMTHQAREKLEKDMLQNNLAFTQNNINEIILKMPDKYKSSIVETIKEVFENLMRTRYGHNKWLEFKLNKSCKIDRIWRTSFSYHYSGWSNKFEKTYYGHGSNFQDVERAFCLLDNKLPKKYPDRWCDKFDKEVKEQSIGLVVECEYFAVTFYKNGNQKVVFKRLDLLEKLNQYGTTGKELFNEKK